MTEDDFLSVYNDTPEIVGKRVGIGDELLKTDKLLSFIEQKDAIAFKIMEEFRATYKEWWNLSKKLLSDREQEDFSTLKSELEKQILRRDEIRKALVSYLNFKYGKANE